MKKLSALFLLVSIFFLGETTLRAQAPTITSFTPASGAPGTLFTITGTNLSSPTAFKIGGVTASAIVVSNTGTSLVGMVMPGAATGTVVVTTSGGTATSSGTFTIQNTSYPIIQQGNKLVGTSALVTPGQGWAVTLSADGTTALVGGYYDNNGVGATWVYTRSGNTWSQQTKLIGTGAATNAWQGFSVALSADGNTAIVGGVVDASGKGAVWIFSRSGTTWSQQGNKLVGSDIVGGAWFGKSVSLSADGNTALVGGYWDNANVGAAWVFTRSGSTWTQQGTKLVGTGAVGAAQQGTGVSLSADGNTAAIGGATDDTNKGATWVFTRSGSTWAQQGNKLLGNDIVGAAKQGQSVSLSADATTLIIGGVNATSNVSNAWVFTRSGTTWTQQGSKLAGSDAVGTAANGTSVTLTADGTTAMMGSVSDNNNTGAAWVFTRSGTTWEQQGNKLLGTGATGTTLYEGRSVALSANGTNALVGADGDNTNQGAVWSYSTGITYDGNGNTGGSVPSSALATIGSSTTLATNTGTLVKTGYTFAGWNTLANGTGTSYASGASYTFTGSVTLYAKWNCITTVSTTNISVCANTPTYTWNGIVRNAPGTYTFTTTNSIRCDSVATLNLTVTAINTVSAASSTPSLCINTPLTNITHITTGATGIAPPNASNYTLPSMIPLAISDPLNEVDLVNVTITHNDSTILNNTTFYNSLSGTIGTASGTAGSYSDFTSFGPYNVYPGYTYSFSLSAHNNPNGIDIGGSRNSMAIYIDYNRNGVYTDAGEKVYAASVASLGPHTESGSFTIPTSTLRGLTRMRVINKQNPGTFDIITSPTAYFQQGEYEEYSLFIGGEVLPGLDISWADNTITISGSPTQTGAFNYSIPLVGGCGNVNATGTITVNSSTSSTTNITICAQQLPYLWNGGSYTSGGVYTYLTSNAKGCDSLVTLNLTIYQPSSSTNIAICASQVPYLWNGGSYTASGVYTYHTSNAIGCDSLATLNLTVNQPTSSIQNITTCKPYFLGGTSYTSSGTYTYNTLNAKGCDSLATLNLTMTTVQYDTTEVTACGSYTWALNNKTYTASGFYSPSIPQVQIGNQVWSSKNLDVATYNNGDSIPEEKDFANWTNLTTGAWIWSGNNSSTGAVYGKLYNLYALTDPRGLLPNGWHLPSVAEWTTLSTALGGSSVAGGKMKVSGTSNWTTPNTGASNSSGFTGLPGGAVSATGTNYTTGPTTTTWSFSSVGNFGVWWAGTSNAVRLNYNNALLDNGSYLSGFRLSGSTYTKYRGLSVRLIKDSLPDCVEHVLKLTILPNTTSVSISASSSTNNICSGTAITFTATAIDAGNSPLYVWKKNGVVVGNNSNAYTNDNWADSAYVQVFMTSSAGCNISSPYTSNKIYVYLENSTPDTWKQKASPFGVRDGAVAFSIGNKGYLGLGKVGQQVSLDYKKDFWQYDPATNVWTQIADYGGYGQINSVGFSIGNKGYVGLGDMKSSYEANWVTGESNYNNSSYLWEYDPLVNTWTKKARFPENTGRYYGLAGFSIGSKGYIGMGFDYLVNYNGTNYVNSQFYEYNPTSDVWTRKADFPVGGIRYAVAFNIGSKGYVGTGQKVIADLYVGAPSFSNDFWEYNPATDIWTQKANFGGTARAYAAGFSIGSKGYIGAGNDGVRKNDFWEYNPSTDAWTQMANFGGAARQSAVGFSIGNKGYLGTGNVPNPTTTAFSAYYSTKDIWEYSANGLSTITTSVAPIAQCPGSSIAVPYSIGCTAFAGGNVFTAQLSDSLGSFANPVNIGTLSSTVSGTINAFIPSSIGFGINYKIRVISSLPETYGTPNDNYFSIGSVVGVASSMPTLCFNSALTNIIHTTTGITGIGTATGLPTGVTASWANDTIKISGTPTDSGTFNYNIPLTGGCGAFSATGTITVKALPEVSIAGDTTICAGAVSTLTVQSNIIAPTQSIPLDEVVGARLAVGLRKLRTTYNGSALRLRRSSDNQEQDFGFAGNDLDQNAIAFWLNGASGYCTKLYDQSGNGGDVSQTIASAQPLLVNSGINNNPSLRFTTDQSMFNSVNYPAPFSVIYGSKVIGTSARVLAAKNNNWLLGYWGGSEDRAYFDGWVSEGSTPTVANQYNIYAATGTGSISTVYKNGTQIASNGSGLTGPNGIQLNGAGYGGSPTETSNCEFSDVVIYGSALSASEIAQLSNNISSYQNYPIRYLWTTGANSPSISVNAVGNYAVTVTNNNTGCSATSSVTVKNPSSTTNVSVCSSATPYLWNAGSYTTSGVYTYQTGSTSGCDSVATLNLTVKNASASIDTISSCSSYTWHGNTYTASNNTATWTGINSTGCDSVVSLHLTISTAKTWIGGTGNWSNAANWCSGSAPSTSDNILINEGSPRLDADFTVAGTLTIGGTGELVVNPLKTLTISGTADFGDKLVTVKSDLTGTGSIGNITGTLTGATNVTVERFIPNNNFRSWRLLSVPTFGTQTINAAWQEGNAPMGNSTPGYGTQVTGTTTALGFDDVSIYPGMLSFNGTNFVGIPRTSIPISTNKAYFLYMRGDRSVGVSSSTSTNTATTLRTNGALYQGTQTTGNIPANSYALIGNPFASAINFSGITRSSGINNVFYVWDSKIQSGNTLGTYQTFSATNNFACPLAGGSFTQGAVNTIIQSGQAFFVENGASTGSISIPESSKIASTGTTGYKLTSELVKIDSRLYSLGTSGSSMADANVVVFDSAYSNAVDGNDASKFSNAGENLAILRNAESLVIEGRKPATIADTIFFKMWNMKPQAYQLEFVPQNLGAQNLSARLEDSYLNTSTPVNLSANTLVNFTVNATLASFASTRFRIVFAPSLVLPVSFQSISASRKASNVQVNWNLGIETNVNRYEVERSTDGSKFNMVGNVAATGNSAYTFTDINPPSSNLFYRIRSIGIAGEVKYSSVVKVGSENSKPYFAVVPNPVEGDVVNIQFGNQPKGVYQLRLVNALGQQIAKSSVSHPGGFGTHAIFLPSAMARGTYQVEIIAPNKSSSFEQILVNNTH